VYYLGLVLAGLYSTGLGINSPLISGGGSLEVRDISLQVGTVFDLRAENPNVDFLGIEGVVITDSPNIGIIKDYNNIFLNNGLIIGSSNLIFDGDIFTIAISNYLINVPGGETGIYILNTANIVNRFRIIFSSIISNDNATAINASDSAFSISESFILDNVRFSGGGDYLIGLTDPVKMEIFNSRGG
jgi:hypothetical protein